MRIWLFLLLVFMLLPCGAREVYRSVSEDGVVSYSDTYKPGAERVSVSDRGSAVANQKDAKEKSQSTDLAGTSGQYQTFTIEQPESDETIRSNAGNVTVGLSLSPSLTAGHVIHVYLDGSKLDSDLTTTQFSLNSLNRGTHSLQAKIVDAEGTPLISTESIDFHMRKASINTH
ncbi:MAG: DUF4124 domain-containing protein [Pseudomonadota bacterium]